VTTPSVAKPGPGQDDWNESQNRGRQLDPLELRHMLFPIRFGCVNRMARREPSWAPYFTNHTTAIFPSLTC
jgi:hypothetical protein